VVLGIHLDRCGEMLGRFVELAGRKGRIALGLRVGAMCDMLGRALRELCGRQEVQGSSPTGVAHLELVSGHDRRAAFTGDRFI
jgi:hypothetical protein